MKYDIDIDLLKVKAKEVAAKAYAPYSRFQVGCALYTKSGNIYVGCNVENASYGLTICAERNAITAAVVAEGKITLQAVVVYTPTIKSASPCGACRQVIAEFCYSDTIIHSFCDSESALNFTASELLPDAFNLNEHQ